MDNCFHLISLLLWKTQNIVFPICNESTTSVEVSALALKDEFWCCRRESREASESAGADLSTAFALMADEILVTYSVLSFLIWKMMILLFVQRFSQTENEKQEVPSQSHLQTISCLCLLNDNIGKSYPFYTSTFCKGLSIWKYSRAFCWTGYMNDS